jgi:predicted PurR-regulated permease PerM
VVVGLSDNVLRPLMLGRGLAVPMPVVLMGVIGGVIVDGLLGLFVGPVLLAVGCASGGVAAAEPGREPASP